MIRKRSAVTKLKIITALTASVCILTLMATSASAFFHAASYPVKIVAHSTGTQIFKFQTNAVLECNKSSLFGVEAAKGDSSQLRVALEYAECETKLAGGSGEKAAISMNDCVFNLAQAKGAAEGSYGIECPGSQTIVVTTNLGCTIKMAGGTANSFLKKFVFTNKSPNIEMKAQVEGITDEVNFVCNIGGIKANKEGTFTGSGLAEGFKSNSPFGKDVIEVI